MIHAKSSALTLVYLLAACLAAPAILRAQTVDPRLIPILTGSVGRTARIQVDSGSSPVTGAIERVRGDTLFLMPKAGTSPSVAIPRVRRAERNHALFQGMDYLIDPPVGALVGGALGAASGNAWPDHWVTRYP